MMTSAPPPKISKATKQILAVLVSNKFQPMKIKNIAARLQEEVNTVNQRILRDEGRYFEVVNLKPKTIQIKRGVKDAVFIRDQNRCYFCKKTFPAGDLDTRHLIEGVPDPDAWPNLVPICASCKQQPELTPPPQKEKGVAIATEKTVQSSWEYTVVLVRGVESKPWILGRVPKDLEQRKKFLEAFQTEEDTYYEFLEVTDDAWDPAGDDWNYIVDARGEKSANLAAILNHFGAKGWELVSVRDLSKRPLDSGDFEDKIGTTELEYTFKRRGVG